MSVNFRLFALTAIVCSGVAWNGPAAETTQTNVPVELAFTAHHEHVDPFHHVALDVEQDWVLLVQPLP